MKHGHSRVFALLLCAFELALLLCSPPARAHEMSMAEMEIRETAPGEFLWLWSAASDKRPMGSDLRPRWPGKCVQSDANIVHCDEQGLKGTFAIDGVGQRYSAALVKITWLDGQSHVYTLTGSQPAVELYGSAVDRRGRFEIFRTYTGLGVQHIASGIDHLLFVIGLLFLVGFNRRLLGTITAFTLAHSLTLASSAFGWLTLRSAPVEATIALSIVLVARESLHDANTLARRMPALVSFLFGLVHGLGFAGALKSIGLPESHLPMALFSFNVGVELGQLMLVLLAFLLVRVPWPNGWLSRARRPAVYAVGIVAAFWCWQRIAAIVA